MAVTLEGYEDFLQQESARIHKLIDDMNLAEEDFEKRIKFIYNFVENYKNKDEKKYALAFLFELGFQNGEAQANCLPFEQEKDDSEGFKN